MFLAIKMCSEYFKIHKMACCRFLFIDCAVSGGKAEDVDLDVSPPHMMERRGGGQITLAGTNSLAIRTVSREYDGELLGVWGGRRILLR